jgi:hypothetical protein
MTGSTASSPSTGTIVIILAIVRTVVSRRSDPAELYFWCGLGLCAGIGLFFYGFRLLQRRQLILDTPFSKIRSAAMGMVEVSGLAVGPYTMVAPITERECYYFRTLVWEWKQAGKSKQWVNVAAECMHVPFFVDDNTGRMLVDPRGADLDLHRDFEQEFSDSLFTTKEPPPANVRDFLARHGVVTSNKIKVEECCIKPKNSLFVMGTLTDNPGLEVSAQPVQDTSPAGTITAHGFSLTLSVNTREFAAGVPVQQLFSQTTTRDPEVIRLSPASARLSASEMTQQQKIAAALVKAGISNPNAWTAAGISSAANSPIQVLDHSSDPAGGNDNGSSHGDGFDLHPPVVLKKGTNDKTFLISWRSQREIVRSLGWKCALMIGGGPALAIVSLYLLLSVKNMH